VKISKLISNLKKYQEEHGDVTLKEAKLVLPTHEEQFYLNSLKDKDKKMTTREYVALCNQGYFGKIKPKKLQGESKERLNDN